MTTKRKIEKLTSAQESRLITWRAEWLQFGCETAPADRPRAQAAVAAMYAEIGKPAPKFLWLDSPMSAALAIGLLRLASERSELGLGDQLWDQLGDQLRGQLRGQLWDQLRDQLWDQLRDHALSAIGREFWGQHEALWVAHYAFARDVVRVKYTAEQSRRLDLWSELAQSCSWWWPNENICVVAERQSVVRWDDRARLHCETGPALAFRDGYSLHSWHGTRVPAEWIEKRAELDPKVALTWQNLEQRRAAAEIVGWGRVLEHVAARVVDADANPYVGTLLLADLPDSPGSAFLRVKCATGREFVLSVPAEMRTAREANAWTYDLKPEELEMDFRT